MTCLGTGVEVTGSDCEPWLGICGEVTGFVPRRMRWTVRLDVGYSTLVRTDQIESTCKPTMKDALRPLQALAWASASLSHGNGDCPVFALAPDLLEAIASIAMAANPPVTLWARFLQSQHKALQGHATLSAPEH